MESFIRKMVNFVRTKLLSKLTRDQISSVFSAVVSIQFAVESIVHGPLR